MDSSAERLKMLQMADLGSARREYISTVDSQRKHLEQVRLEDIEAARLSNVAGTNAQRMAERNKSKLSDWANVYKKLGDAEDLEHLDNLLDGQTHRAQLSSTLRGNTERNHEKVDIKDHSSSKTAELSFSRSRGAWRGLGRGGGTAGSKRRGSNTPLFSDMESQGTVTKLGNHTVESPHRRTRGLDPALDEERDEKSHHYADKHGTQKSPHKILRTRRVAPVSTGGYLQGLSSPDDFLATARRIVKNNPNAPGNPNTTTPLSSSIASSEQQKQAPNTVEEGKAVMAKDAGSPSCQSPGSTTSRVSTDRRKGISAKNSIPESAPTTEKDKTPFSVSSTPTSKVSKTEGRAEVADLKPLDQNIPASKANEANLSERQPLQEGLTSIPPQHIQSSIKGIAKEHEGDKTKTEEVGVLLDFDSSPEDLALEKPSATKEQPLLRTPVFEDLEGIDFSAQNAADSSLPKPLLPEPASGSREKLDFQKHADVHDSSDSGGSNYRRDISIIDNLIETMSLSKEVLYSLKGCKKELELKLRLTEQLPIDDPRPPQTIDESRETLQPAITSTSEPDLVDAAAEKLKAEEPKAERTAIRGRASEKGGVRPGLSHSTSPLESKLKDAVTAPPFVSRASSFTKYRSPTHSISSVSSSSLVSPIRPASPAPPHQRNEQQHIFGDHILPGRRASRGPSLEHDGSSRSEEKPKVRISIPPRSSVSEVRPSVLKGFGGNSENPSPETQRVATTTLFTPNPEAELFTPISVYPPESTKEKHVTPTLNLDTKPVRIVNSSNSNPLQQSIHAPRQSQRSPHELKPIEKSVNVPKPSRQPGLQNSRWATSENQKPLR